MKLIEILITMVADKSLDKDALWRLAIVVCITDYLYAIRDSVHVSH